MNLHAMEWAPIRTTPGDGVAPYPGGIDVIMQPSFHEENMSFAISQIRPDHQAYLINLNLQPVPRLSIYPPLSGHRFVPERTPKSSYSDFKVP